MRDMLTSINHLWKEGSAECFKKQNDEQKLVKAFAKGDYFGHQIKESCFIPFPHIFPLLGVAFSCHFQYGTGSLGFLNFNLQNMPQASQRHARSFISFYLIPCIAQRLSFVEVCGAGDIFGELALLYNCPRAVWNSDSFTQKTPKNTNGMSFTVRQQFGLEISLIPGISIYRFSGLHFLDQLHRCFSFNLPILEATVICKEKGILWELDRESFNNIIKVRIFWLRSVPSLYRFIQPGCCSWTQRDLVKLSQGGATTPVKPS